MAANQFLTLYQIVESYRLQEERPESKFASLYQLAIRGFKKLEANVSGIPKTEEVDVLSNKTAFLPSGALSLISVGILLDDGTTSEIPELTDLSLLNSESDARTSEDAEESTSSCEGLSYRHDRENGRLVFPFNFSYTSVIVEYLSAYKDSSDDIIVRPEIEEALIAWLRWQDNMNGSARDRNRHDFFEEVRQANRRLRRFNIKDIYSWKYTKPSIIQKGKLWGGR